MDNVAHWPDIAETYFIDLCYEEVKQRNGSSLFGRKNWNRLELAMIEKFGKAYRQDRLKQKWHRLRNSTQIFQGLTEATGFGWDTNTNTVTADEEVWETYIQKYPAAKRFKRKGLAHYDKLREIFVRKIATGAMAMSMGPLEVAVVGKAATAARIMEKVASVSATASVPDVEEVGDSSDKVLEVRKKIAVEKSTTKKRKSLSGKGMWQEAVESRTKNERYTKDRLITFLEEKEARKMSVKADSMTRDEVFLKQCVEKLAKHAEFLTDQQYSGFVMELVKSKDLRIAFLSIPDELTMHFLIGLRGD